MAVDRASGEVYVLDDLQPEGAEQPRGLVDVFEPSGAYVGHLLYEVVDGGPSGLAVDNSAGSTQERVYVTSGNTLPAGLYAYPLGAATTEAPLLPAIPRRPSGGERLEPTMPIGGPAAGGGARIECQGDSCQVLPSQPIDPTLTTLLAGPGNPKVRYRRYRRRRHAHRRRHRHYRHRGLPGRHGRAVTGSAPARRSPPRRRPTRSRASGGSATPATVSGLGAAGSTPAAPAPAAPPWPTASAAQRGRYRRSYLGNSCDRIWGGLRDYAHTYPFSVEAQPRLFA